MIFSSRLANTLPLVSEAMQVGGSEGKTKTIGPTRSLALSALTQLSSAADASSFAVATAFEDSADASPNLAAVSTRFRFLGFGSPLNESAFTMMGSMWGLAT